MPKAFFVPPRLSDSPQKTHCAGAVGLGLLLALPGVVAVGIYLFIASWSEYLFALMLAGRNIRTVTVALQMFIGENEIHWGLLTAAGSLVALPAVGLFLFAQRHLAAGLTGGAVKG